LIARRLQSTVLADVPADLRLRVVSRCKDEFRHVRLCLRWTTVMRTGNGGKMKKRMCALSVHVILRFEDFPQFSWWPSRQNSNISVRG
jgi:hypothetical protein